MTQKPALSLPPDVPDYLDAEARIVWDRLAPSLAARGMLTAWDVDLFAAYCTAVVHHRRAVRSVNDTAVLLKTPAGAVKHPALQVVRDQLALMAQVGGRFGLTPEDRSQVVSPTDTETPRGVRDELKDRRDSRQGGRSAAHASGNA